MKRVIIGLICILISVVIGMLVIKSLKKETDTISLDEVCMSLQFYDLDKDEWKEVFKDKISDPVRYTDMERILTILGIKDYVLLPDEVYNHKKQEPISKDEYFLIYEKILELLDIDKLVKKQNITVKKVFEVTNEQGVICSDTYIFRVLHGFGDYKIGNTYEIYSIGMDILGYRAMVKEESAQDFSNPKIRVLLTEQGVREFLPDDICINLNGKYTLYYKNSLVAEVENQSFLVSDYLKADELKKHMEQGGFLRLVPQDENGRFDIKFGDCNTNPYRGELYVYPKEGKCFLVNELLVEQYLYGVIPSEMPASYHSEALKTQAVCARSYAYMHLLGGGMMEYYAHVDDTTSYQVYNKSKEHENSNRAVNETCGQYLKYQDDIVSAYYFSTSMGMTAGASIWGLDETQYGYLKGASKFGVKDLSDEKSFIDYISQIPTDDFESDCRYYRWKGSVQIKKESINQAINERLKKDCSDMGNIKDVYVKQRDKSGGISKLSVCFEKGEIDIEGEYNIRYCLGACETQITLLNGETIKPTMLPSAYFYISDYENDVCEITGGGYGHGLGMSQNGANGMAQTGYTYDEILSFYYSGSILCKSDEE